MKLLESIDFLDGSTIEKAKVVGCYILATK